MPSRSKTASLVSGLLGLNVLSRFNISLAFLKRALTVSQ
jgi:hypothetical protein